LGHQGDQQEGRSNPALFLTLRVCQGVAGVELRGTSGEPPELKHSWGTLAGHVISKTQSAVAQYPPAGSVLIDGGAWNVDAGGVPVP
jgi:hypothetical protein